MMLQDALNKLFPGNTGVTQAHGVNGEQGIDIGVPAGTPIRAIRGGIYRPDLSTNYAEVLEVAPNEYQSYTHVDNGLAALAPVYIPAGTVVGNVSARTGTVKAANGAGGTVTYHSDGYHVEFGDYATAQGAAYYQGGADPTPALQQAASAGNQLAAAGQNLAGMAAATISPQQIVIALLVVVGLVLILRR